MRSLTASHALLVYVSAYVAAHVSNTQTHTCCTVTCSVPAGGIPVQRLHRAHRNKLAPDESFARLTMQCGCVQVQQLAGSHAPHPRRGAEGAQGPRRHVT